MRIFSVPALLLIFRSHAAQVFDRRPPTELPVVGFWLRLFPSSGCGLPLHKFDRAHDAFLWKELPVGAFSRTPAIFSRAPLWSTLSRVVALSPAMFPRPHMTCSTTSIWFEASICTKLSRTPFSMRLFTWSVVPEAILVRHQAASNWNFAIGWCRHWMIKRS